MRHVDDQEPRSRNAREAAELLLDHRDAVQPPTGAVDAGWRALQARIAAGDVGPTLEEEPPVGARGGRRALVIGALAVAAGLALWQLSPDALVRGGGERGVEAVFHRVDPGEASRARVRVPAVPVPKDSSKEDGGPTEVVAPPPVPVHKARPAADLAAELAQLRGIGEALRAGDGEGAVTRAETYLRVHPTGAFAPEARLHHAEALCLLGRDADARAVAAAFVHDLPSSPLRGRITAVCPETTPEK